MLVHTVLFNLTPGMSAEEIAAFEKDLETLTQITAATSCYIGKVAGTDKRPVVKTDWDYMLTVMLEDIAAHDVYQAHPIHLEFIAKQKAFFGQVRVFDSE